MAPTLIWSCKIGETASFRVDGADAPMRDAVRREYKHLTGQEPEFIFSGWGAELTEGERAVVEHREPVYERTEWARDRRVEELEAENERLRKGLHQISLYVTSTRDTTDDLRELIDRMQNKARALLKDGER